jgi:putative hydrolase of the HAD superfamily
VSTLQVIFFDAAGTLFHVKGSVAEIYLQYGEKYGLKRTPEMVDAIKATFRRAFHDAPPPAFGTTDPVEIKRCERLWWFDVVHTVFYRIGMFEGFDDYFEEVFAGFDGPQHWMMYPETLGVLKELKSQGYELGIISNFDSRLFTVLRGLGLADFFSTVTISSIAHAAKPSKAIFRVALEKHAAEPQEALHVGDSLRDDVEGARSAGLHAALLQRDGEPTTIPASIRVLRSLEQLRAVVATI